MDYLLLVTEAVHSELELGLGKHGNMYYVQLYRDGNLTHKMFSTIEKALAAYRTLAEWMALNHYTEGYHRKWLESQEG